MELLDAYAEPLRSFMAADFKATRKELGITQLKMAELLDIDLRSYANLEHGKSLCSTPVLLRYICFCMEDPSPYLKHIKQIMESSGQMLAG